MKKFIIFCKSHFREMLFVLFSVLTLAGAGYSALCFSGLRSSVGIILAGLAQLALREAIQKGVNGDSFLKMPITIGFIYFTVFIVLIIGCSIVTLNSYAFLGLTVVLLFLRLILVYISRGKKKKDDVPKPEPAASKLEPV